MRINQKEKIVNVALESFLKENSYSIRMDEIAVRLNTSIEAIRKIFPTDEDLLREVIESFMKSVLET